MSDTEMTLALRAEVEAMHDFLAAWFRGEETADQSHFETNLIDRFAPDLRIIYPSGVILTRDDLVKPIFAAHGSNPSFRVSIRDFELIALSSDTQLAIACYIEDQFNALNTNPSDNSRLSTVVFRISADPDRIEWRHIHETAIT